MLKRKYSSNTLLLIVNINILLLQCVVFVSWYNTEGGDNLQGSADDVQVFDNIREIGLSDQPKVDNVIPNMNNVVPNVDNGEPKVDNGLKKEEPKEGSIGVVPKGYHQTSKNNSWDWNWDGGSGSNSVRNRYIYLVRHGQYYGNGPYENHLSPLGQLQANKVGEKLKSYNITFHRFVSSTTIRAAETADLIHRHLPYVDIEFTNELQEGWPSFPDPPSPGLWDKDNPIFENDIPRLDQAFSAYIHRAKAEAMSDTNEVIVCHGNVIAYFVLRALQVAPSRWLKIGVLQGSITLLHIEPNGDVALRILGDVGHLDKIEWSG